MGKPSVARRDASCGKFICYCHIFRRFVAAYKGEAYIEAGRLQVMAEEVAVADECDCPRVEAKILSCWGVRR